MKMDKKPESLKKKRKGKTFVIPPVKRSYHLILLSYKDSKSKYTLQSNMWEELLKQELSDTDIERFRREAHQLIDESCSFLKGAKD